jgi:hypothetical protein
VQVEMMKNLEGFNRWVNVIWWGGVWGGFWELFLEGHRERIFSILGMNLKAREVIFLCRLTPQSDGVGICVMWFCGMGDH